MFSFNQSTNQISDAGAESLEGGWDSVPRCLTSISKTMKSVMSGQSLTEVMTHYTVFPYLDPGSRPSKDVEYKSLTGYRRD